MINCAKRENCSSEFTKVENDIVFTAVFFDNQKFLAEFLFGCHSLILNFIYRYVPKYGRAIEAKKTTYYNCHMCALQ